MNATRKVSPLVAGSLALSFAALAQTALQQPVRRKVSLLEALQLAAKQGPDVAAARAQADVARAGVNKAFTAWQPDLSAAGTYDHTNAFANIDLSPLGRELNPLAPSFPPNPFS